MSDVPDYMKDFPQRILHFIEELKTEIADREKKLKAAIEFADAVGLGELIVEKTSPNKTTSEPVSQNGASSQPVKVPFGQSKWPVAIGDASVKILKEFDPQNKGMKLEDILEHLKPMQVFPTDGSLDAALRNDSKKRFKKAGIRTYALN